MKHLSEYHDPQFYLEGVIKRQVDHEAWVSWALQPNPPLPPITPREATDWSEATKTAIKRSVSILIA